MGSDVATRAMTWSSWDVFEPGERVWLDVRGRHGPAVVTGTRAGRVQLRVQRAKRWDAVRIVRGRARPGALSRRESLALVDGGWRA